MIEKKFDFKKSLGQNFLIDNNIKEKIVESVDINSDLIIEIGPGSGALTEKLVKLNKQLICFEIDKRLEDKLSKLRNNSTKIVFEDFLNVKLSEYIKSCKRIAYIGNLPYYITTAIINKIVFEGNPAEIIIMIQKEVGERFIAKPCTKEYGSLSVFLQYNFDIQKICSVSRNCFMPAPNVDSVVLKLVKKENGMVNDETKLYELIKNAFVHKRKNLKNNLYMYNLNIIEEVLKKHEKSLSCRAEELSVGEFIDISNAIN